MRNRIALILLAALPLYAGHALRAAESVEATPNGITDEITVTGQRRDALRLIMQDFITEIGAPVSRNFGYARWQRDVCVGVSGLTDAAGAQYFANRISLRALELGLQVEEPGCRPNILVIFTADGRGMASGMVAEQPRTFRPFGGEGGTTQGLEALDEFVTADVAVRWWQVMVPLDDTGQPAIDMTNGLAGMPFVSGTNSHIRHSVSEALWSSIVVVDTSKLGDVNWLQLADYISLISLAQIKPDGAPRNQDSILNLFLTESPPPQMTAMDLTYLHALYQMDNERMPARQRGLFANQMLRENQSTGAQ